MKKLTKLVGVVVIVAMLTMLLAATGVGAKDYDCITGGDIEYGTGHYLDGEVIPTGYDIYGYNYQAHMFNGYYINAYIGRSGSALPPYEGDEDAYLASYPEAADHWAWPYRDVKISMKWNDAWLANSDKDGDGVLDRHFGFDSYSGSGAWLTNHEQGINDDGSKYVYFVKIIAAPADAYKENGIWLTADGEEIGPVIWGAFAIIQEVDSNGDNYNSPLKSGLGNW